MTFYNEIDTLEDIYSCSCEGDCNDNDDNLGGCDYWGD